MLLLLPVRTPQIVTLVFGLLEIVRPFVNRNCDTASGSVLVRTFVRPLITGTEMLEQKHVQQKQDDPKGQTGGCG